MPRRPEVSLGVGLATVTIVWTVYNRGLPSSADIRVGQQGDPDLETVRKQNAWMAASIVAGISLIAKDPTVFILGGSSVVLLDWTTRVNNWTNPLSGRVDLNPFTVEGNSSATPEVDYSSDLQAVS